MNFLKISVSTYLIDRFAQFKQPFNCITTEFFSSVWLLPSSVNSASNASLGFVTSNTWMHDVIISLLWLSLNL